jgi:hypothetical protein
LLSPNSLNVPAEFVLPSPTHQPHESNLHHRISISHTQVVHKLVARTLPNKPANLSDRQLALREIDVLKLKADGKPSANSRSITRFQPSSPRPRPMISIRMNALIGKPASNATQKNVPFTVLPE